MPTRRSVTALLASLLVLACGNGGGPENSSEVLAAKELSLTLLDPGAEPRRELRYVFEAGRREVFLMDMKMTTSVELDGQKLPAQPMPTVTATMRIDSAGITPEGELRYAFVFEGAEPRSDPAISPQMIAMLEESLGSLEGFTGSGTMDPRGFQRDVEIVVPPNAPPILHQMIDGFREQMSRISWPFPEEPVGVGARWKLVMPVEHPMLKLVQEGQFELVELGPDGGRLALTLTQHAPPQEMHPPGMPDGTSFHIDSMESRGEGTMSFRFDRLVPTSHTTLEMDMQATVRAEKQTQRMAMHMEADVGVRPGE